MLGVLLSQVRLKNLTYFYYKQRKYIVVLKIYERGECRPSEYAKIKLEFIKYDKNESIKGWADFYEVHFNSVFEFCQFFGVERGEGNRNLFVDFSEKFAQAIPRKKSNVNNDKTLRNIQASRCEADGTNAIYCCGVIRNGLKKMELLNIEHQKMIIKQEH